MIKKRLFIILLFSISCLSQKINGISFVASNTPVTYEIIQPIVGMNANWITLMPFGFMKTTAETTIQYNSKRQWWGETKVGITKTAIEFHKLKIKTMLKPQIWIPNGGFTGQIKMKNEQDWFALEKSYETFILDYAQVAQDSQFEIFCMGTELNNFVISRPDYWEKLIQKIKKIYKGKLTYAENWDTYKNVPFIKELDYIGIDAYFPLSKDKTPTVDSIEKAWKPIKKGIRNLSSKYHKSVLFTEFGYQSKDFTTLEPWNHSESNAVNIDGQKNALQALFNTFWNEKWFAGGFLWKWYDTKNAGKIIDSDYTIQNKPAQESVRTWFKKHQK
ncbi:MAG: glycoside hydrolase [Flavobacterium sp.]|nr:glycoside hydrolase [Flavobacterium sp.]